MSDKTEAATRDQLTQHVDSGSECTVGHMPGPQCIVCAKCGHYIRPENMNEECEAATRDQLTRVTRALAWIEQNEPRFTSWADGDGLVGEVQVEWGSVIYTHEATASTALRAIERAMEQQGGPEADD